jgi:hypothetical protein
MTGLARGFKHSVIDEMSYLMLEHFDYNIPGIVGYQVFRDTDSVISASIPAEAAHAFENFDVDIGN